MKKTLSVILGLLLVLSLVACNSTSGKAKATDEKGKETVQETKKENKNKKDDAKNMKEVLEAKVEEVHDESILVKDKEGVPYLVLSKVKDIKKGDTVKITYDGVVATSDPGQITNVYSIEKK
ncbi:hypothetical protein [uncultured Helcococcus sp.]|uniref:hypothetical protein n=1 Tax=uncultured Helcococcus sp. TaxID=1072508 RepID=UPI002627256D|nr:hypothetical protein [uncultured Helcococcus sp.]